MGKNVSIINCNSSVQFLFFYGSDGIRQTTFSVGINFIAMVHFKMSKSGLLTTTMPVLYL